MAEFKYGIPIMYQLFCGIIDLNCCIMMRFNGKTA